MRKSFLIAILDWPVLKKIDGFLIKRYVIKRSKKLNKSIPADINRKIYEFENMFAPDIWIRVSYMKDGFTSLLNGKAVNPNGVLLTPEWAARLLLFNDDDTINAFLVTVGHEMTHNEGDFSTRGFYSENKKFINWVNEVHADFGAAQRMVNSNKTKLLESIDYKINLKKPKKNILLILLEKFVLLFINESTHPSWKQRRAYAETGAFNRKLIDTIATDTGCTNIGLIEDIANFYKDIVLTD